MSASTFHFERTASTGMGVTVPTDSCYFQYPQLTSTVPKEFVHRSSVAEVLLTGWTRKDDSNFTVAAQWPRAHSFFTPVEGCYDPLIGAETVRQAGILLAHTEFNVPLDYSFLALDLWIDIEPRHFVVGDAPASLDIEVACRDIKRRRGALAGLRLEAVFRRDGQIAATGGGSLNCVSPAVYRRLRPMRGWNGFRAQVPLTAPAAPQSVGRVSSTDVVLSPTPEPDRWQLRLDTRHPVLFDHPVDHVPGMVLMEAARQATAAHLGRVRLPRRVVGEFLGYAELDAPCLIETRRAPQEEGDRETVLVTGRQGGNDVFRSTVEVARHPV